GVAWGRGGGGLRGRMIVGEGCGAVTLGLIRLSTFIYDKIVPLYYLSLPLSITDLYTFNIRYDYFEKSYI
ncbi:hypothetical protein, partial [Salmonella enterica]|uniref:hypothetical protein n=1 Tax=Salmonella enterica TaxID=28901 RepID=UPI001C6FD874